jgi:hypothetical protein
LTSRRSAKLGGAKPAFRRAVVVSRMPVGVTERSEEIRDEASGGKEEC